MSYTRLASRLPSWLRRRIWHFEALIEESVRTFAAGLPPGAFVLDAGAGEGRYRDRFEKHRYVGVDLGVGDARWNYAGLDAVADLASLPFRESSFHACLNIVTLEHVRRPAQVLREISRVLVPGGRLLLVVPQDWEVHQAPHDYYRYTLHGVSYLLEQAGLTGVSITPAGGYFRLMSRRLLNGLEYFSGGFRWLGFVPAMALLGLPALLFSYLDFLDHKSVFTLGYLCTAAKRS